MKALLLVACVAAALAAESEPTLSEADRLKAEEALARLLIEERVAEAIPPVAEPHLAIAEVACWEIVALLDQGCSGAAAERILAARAALAELPDELLAQPPKRVRRVQDELLRLGSRLLLEVGLDEDVATEAEEEAPPAAAAGSTRAGQGADIDTIEPRPALVDEATAQVDPAAGADDAPETSSAADRTAGAGDAPAGAVDSAAATPRSDPAADAPSVDEPVEVERPPQ